MDEKKSIISPKNILILCAIIAGAVGLSMAGSMLLPLKPFSPDKKLVYVVYGSGFKKASRDISRAGLLRNRFVFETAAFIAGVRKKIRAGEYEFSPSESGFIMLYRLVTGDVKKHKLVIPEGFDIYDIAQLLADEKLADRELFLAMAKDREFLKTIGIGHDTAEGFLFPDTYYFVLGEGEKRIIETMYGRFRKKSLIDTQATYTIQGYTLSGYYVLKMASLIEKESKLDAERPKVASVFYNRLKSSDLYMKKLESCATVRYALRKKTGELTYRDLKVDSPYNTYVRIGLPVAPICNPGVKSMQAALNPAKTEYRFFVVRDEGEHTFSVTLDEHNRAKAQYKKRRNRP
ncbi:MAG: endolytic transglycosylase MltG [Spirochaetia bacterium]|nr:endolytic transglycosylase MltG [Spirochaetia bacterium]